MPKKVATIEKVFVIEGLGTVIELPVEGQWHIAPHETIHKRERVQIRTPSGKCISTFIKGIEMINRGPAREGVCLSLPRSIRAEDIPDLSELWLERDGGDPLLEN